MFYMRTYILIQSLLPIILYTALYLQSFITILYADEAKAKVEFHLTLWIVE